VYHPVAYIKSHRIPVVRLSVALKQTYGNDSQTWRVLVLALLAFRARHQFEAVPSKPYRYPTRLKKLATRTSTFLRLIFTAPPRALDSLSPQSLPEPSRKKTVSGWSPPCTFQS
jgi:hypothetical protein